MYIHGERGNSHGYHVIYRLVFVFARIAGIIASINLRSFRKHVRCSDVFGTVRSAQGYTEDEKRERERENDGELGVRARIYTHPHDLMHTVIRYTEGLGSLSLLSSSRSVSARRHLFFPRSNNSWGQPFWELTAARSYCSIVTLNARLRALSCCTNILPAFLIPRSVFKYIF